MKRSEVAKTLPKAPAKSREGYTATAQQVEEMLVLNVYRNGKLCGRYVLDVQTYEYGILSDGTWSRKKFPHILGENPLYFPYWEKNPGNFTWDKKEDKDICYEMLNKIERAAYDKRWLRKIEIAEYGYGKKKYETAQERKAARIRAMMDKVREIPEDLREWLFQMEVKENYLFFEKEKKKYGCSRCGKSFREEQITRKGTKEKARHNDRAVCPGCKTEAVVKRRQKNIVQRSAVCLLQPLDEKNNIARHFSAEIELSAEGHKVWLEEKVRITLNRTGKGKVCGLYYNQDMYTYSWSGIERGDRWDSNPRNKRIKPCYLYPEGIREALEKTGYSGITRDFEGMAAAGVKTDYNGLMMRTRVTPSLGGMLEYLCKGRFWKLLQEVGENKWGTYQGILIFGETIEEVFGLCDRQKINRIRDNNGGYIMLEWLQLAEEQEKKVSQEALNWLEENQIKAREVRKLPGRIMEKMSIDQIAHYLEKQKKDYKTAKEVLEHWGDYLSMCEVSGKKLDADLIYKPRELKKRHDEVVENREKLETVKRMKENPERRAKEAEEMKAKFPEAQRVLKEIKDKYELESEEFVMKMPENLVEIVEEGYALHHCGGSSERYFNRIANRETYIGFCRRKKEPQIPFYTIEFEPDGTIRQNRSYYDEEPNIEEIRGFLKEWQRKIKKRLNGKDLEYQKQSKVLRERNIEELKQKRNTFVLEKLMEDFMEAG